MGTGEDWLNGIRAALLSVSVLSGAEKAEKAVVAMAPVTASRGLLLCGMTDIRQLEEAVGRRIYLDVGMPAGEFLILDGERLAKSTV